MKAKQTAVETIEAIETRRVVIKVVGTSPLIMHRFSFKARQELLNPSPKKNASERATTLKHNPLEEYRECFYRNRNAKSPALFHLPKGTVHGALASAALDIPGATRASIERLTQVIGHIDLFGVPKLFMSMVRSSDIAKTPDVRTRPIFERWACKVEIEYKTNPLTDNQVLNLLSAAGFLIGIGDWRRQKGGEYGAFRVANENDAEFREICKQGRSAQQAAYDKPEEYDEDTSELLAWFNSEVARRRHDVPAGKSPPAGKRSIGRPRKPRDDANGAVAQ